MNTSEPIQEPECEFAAFQADQKHWSPCTHERCQAWLGQLQDYLASRDLTWDHANAKILKDFEVHLQWVAGRQGLYAANTVYQALRMIRAFYRWAAARGLAAKDPTRDWILARPRSVPAKLLSQLELLQLFNLPDPTKWSGQRDALLLALVFHGGYSLSQCCRIRWDQLTWTGQEDPFFRAAFDRYMKEGRADSAGNKQRILLLTRFGKPTNHTQTFRVRLRALGKQIGHPNLTVRDLRQTKKAHQTELSKRLTPLL